MKLVLIIHSCVIFGQLCICFGFFGRTLKDDIAGTKTHIDITSSGIQNALTQYVKDRKGASSLFDFFGKEIDSQTTMMLRVNALGSSVANAQNTYINTTYIHCHADQIALAHDFVKSCKNRLTDRKEDIEELIKQLGECLYTLQSFYSNTNWVEMNGAEPYTDFGQNDLMAIVSGDQPSCKDIESKNSGCEDNILVNTMLTSGYHHGRGSKKPRVEDGSKTGKCSHGGPEDSSRNEIARCGINKDSLSEAWSPHYHHHKAAYTAAIEATKYYLIAPETGILHILGEDIFDDLFHIKTKRHRKSLSFAVDFSGSMTDDIAVVKEQVTELVVRSFGTVNAPANYVLTLFSDPEHLTSGNVYYDGNDMIDAISKVVVTGGGDCPEYACSGLMKAIYLSLKNSTIYLFTDASAKDENRRSEVKTAALKKNITITSIVTGNCSYWYSSKTKVKRETSFFQDIAEATGGKVYIVKKENLGSLLNEVLEDEFPTSETIQNNLPVIVVQSFIWNLEGDKRINVDDSIVVLSIHINESLSELEIGLFHENGVNKTLLARMYTDGNETLIVLENPPPGNTYLKRNTSNVWIVNITAQITTYAYFEILEYTNYNDVIPVQGSLITGSIYSVTWHLNNFNENGSCLYISLVDLQGTVLSSHLSSTHHSDFFTRCSADITATNKMFKLMLNGTDGHGFTFSRESSSLIRPVTAKLKVEAILVDVVVGRMVDVGFELTNMGNSTKTYDVLLTDERGFAVLPTFLQLNLTGGETHTGSFSVKPTAPSLIFAYTITVIDSISKEVQQEISKKLVVTDIERPVCSVVAFNASCDDPAFSYFNCSLYSWNAVTNVIFSGTKIASISSTGASFVNLYYDDYHNLVEGSIGITINGSCCYPNVDITVIDKDGFISQCKLDFSFGKDIYGPIEVVSLQVQQKDSDDDNHKRLTIGILVSIAVIIFSVIVIRKCIKNRQIRIQNSNASLNNERQNQDNEVSMDVFAVKVKSDVVKKPTFNTCLVQKRPPA